MAHSPFRTNTLFDLAAELDGLDAASPSSYRICSDEIDVSTLSTGEQNALLNNLIDQLALTRPEELPREQDLWNSLRTVLKYFENLEDNARSKVVDGITSAFAQLIVALKRDADLASSSHRTGTMLDDSDDEDTLTPEELRRMYCETLEMWAFLVNWLLVMADHVANSSSTANGSSATAAKPKGRSKKALAAASSSTSSSSSSGFPWHSQLLPSLLQVVSGFLQTLPSLLLYPLPTPRESILSAFVRPTLAILDREANLKANSDLKTQVIAITCLAVKRHGQGQMVQPVLLQMLQYHDHLPEAVAQLLTVLRLDYDSPRLAEEVLVEIANREFASGGVGLAMTASMENKVPRTFARFLVAFTEANPRTTLKTISLLQKLIDSESYPLRNAIVEVFYLLIRDLVMTNDDQLPNSAGGRGADTAFAQGEVETRETSDEVRKRQIEGFWKILLERFLDVNSYVRVKVLNMCVKLCDLPAKFPAQRTRLLSLAQRALKDKSSSARKAAITLITRMILTHPYGILHGGELKEEVWTARVEKVERDMKALGGGIELPVDDTGPEGVGDEEDEEQDDADETEAADTTARKKPRKSINVEQLSAQLTPQDMESLHRLRLAHRYCADALHFIKSLSTSMETLEELLFSSNKGEALEAMDFFRIAAEYKLPGAEQGMRRMVHLVWMKDNVMVEPTAGGVTGAAGAEERDGPATGPATAPKSIKGRLIEVYTSLYFSPSPQYDESGNIASIARNLVERTLGATLAELTSLEELLSTMSGEQLIPLEVVDKLWAVYASPTGVRKSSQKSLNQKSNRRGAIIILSMLAASRKEIVEDKIDVLLGVGLGQLGKADPVLAKWTVVALGRVGGSAKKVKGALSDKRSRFPMTHPMFGKLRAAVLSAGLADEPGKDGTKGEWFSLAENCIQVIYELGEQPDRLCGDIIKWFMVQVFGAKDGQDTHARDDSIHSEHVSRQPNISSSHPALHSSASAFLLAQMVFVIGHIALKQIVYLESVEREYKRRKALQEKSVKSGPGASASGRSGQKAAKGASKSKTNNESTTATAEPEGDELEQVAGNVEDEVGETMANVREHELLFGERSLLRLFGPLVVHIASNPKSYASDHLRRAAVLTLCKFMCVSSRFCESHLSLLLHILTTSSDPITRSNVVIALGDIAVSFGNLVDADSDRLYAGLNDKDLGVKKHTLMVLTHLILNGMIKVKGQLGEMAKCLEDPEARVSNLAKLFFSELATKENAVYNNLPDIISHLSIGKHAVDEETFERTMRFIFTFIDKEKQAENVIEKLCQRFRLTSAERQWRDIAFCLSLLPFKSERSMKKLIEGLPFYQDKVRDPDVYKRFVEIIQKARGSKAGGGAGVAKAGGSSTGVSETELQDFETALEGFHQKGAEEMELEKGGHAKAAKAQVSASRGARGEAKIGARATARGTGGRVGTSTRGGRQGRRRGRADSSEEEGEEEEEEEEEEEASVVGEVEDDEEEEEAVARGKRRPAAAASRVKPAPRAATARAAAGRRKAIVYSSEEGEDDDDDSF